MISNKNLKLLRIFSESANKSTGSSHPCDTNRWLKFIISAYRDNEILSLDDLRKLLNNMGWEKWERETNNLLLEYEIAISTLQANDKF